MFTAFNSTNFAIAVESMILVPETDFSDKALAAYLVLEDVARKNSQRVKEEMLRAYEVTPEHYTKKCRTTKVRVRDSPNLLMH